MKRVVVVDSSANLAGENGGIVSVPMKVLVDGHEFVDDSALDLSRMFQQLDACSGPTSTSCPNIAEWRAAFEGADEVFALALTSKISGGFNAAQAAAKHYLFDRPEAQVFVLDSLTTGPELELLAERACELAASDAPFDDVVHELRSYARRTHLMFSLEKLENFVRNGRVKPLVAKAAGVLGIRIVGEASPEGELELMNKVRGEKHAIKQVLSNMRDAGFAGGRVRIRHTENPAAAARLAELIRAEWPDCDLAIGKNGALCSYYCEPGGVLVGFEG